MAGVSDQATDTLLVLFNTEEGRATWSSGRGVIAAWSPQFGNFGLSGLCNMLAAIKTAKYFDLGPDDVILTVATDGGGALWQRDRQGERQVFRRSDSMRWTPAKPGADRSPPAPTTVLELGHSTASGCSTSAISPGSSNRAFRWRSSRRVRGKSSGTGSRSGDGLGRHDRRIQRQKRRRRIPADMTAGAASPNFVCHGCGAVVDIARRLPFACPNAGVAEDDIDHVLVLSADGHGVAPGHEANPFLRYRGFLSPYRLARAARLPDDAWTGLVGDLDAALRAVDGHGFRVTPMTRQPALATALGLNGDLWVKDETAARRG